MESLIPLVMKTGLYVLTRACRVQMVICPAMMVGKFMMPRWENFKPLLRRPFMPRSKATSSLLQLAWILHSIRTSKLILPKSI